MANLPGFDSIWQSYRCGHIPLTDFVAQSDRQGGISQFAKWAEEKILGEKSQSPIHPPSLRKLAQELSADHREASQLVHAVYVRVLDQVTHFHNGSQDSPQQGDAEQTRKRKRNEEGKAKETSSNALKRQKTEAAKEAGAYWHQYKTGTIQLKELFEAITASEDTLQAFQEWALGVGCRQESPMQLIGTIELLAREFYAENPEVCAKLQTFVSSVRNAAFSLSQLPKDILKKIGRKLSVHEAGTFSSISKEMNALSGIMQIRSSKQASKILSRLLFLNDDHQQALEIAERWMASLPRHWKINIKIPKKISLKSIVDKLSTPFGKILKRLDEHFGENLTLDMGIELYADLKTIHACLPKTRFALTISPYSMKKLGITREVDTIEALNKIFTEIPNIQRLTIRNLKLGQSFAQKIQLPNTLLSLSIKNISPFLRLPRLPDSLRILKIIRSNLTDAYITQLSHLQHVQELNVSWNRPLEGKTFSFLPASLRKLNCSGCILTDESIKELHHLQQLRELDLSYNYRLQGETFSSLSPSLIKLNCSRCSVTDASIKKLHHLQQLQELDVGSTRTLRGQTFSFLPASLIKLYCPGCVIEDASIKELHHLQKLQELDISGNHMLKGETFSSLPASLIQLRCSHGSLTDASIKELHHLQKLQELDTRANHMVKGQTFSSLPASLIKLNCSYCLLTDASIKELSHLHQLQELDVSANRSLEGKTFSFLPATLLGLDCGNCLLTDASIPYLSHLKQLQALNIHFNKQLKGRTLSFLPDSLRSLVCADCSLEYESIPYLSFLKNLQWLDVMGNSEIEGPAYSLLPDFLIKLLKKCYGKICFTD